MNDPDFRVDADALSTFVGNSRAAVEESKIHFEGGVAGMTAVDPANVLMVDQTLGGAAFDVNRLDGLTLGLALERFADVIGFADSADAALEAEFDDSRHTLDMQAGGLDYTLATIDTDSIRAEPDMGELDLPVEVTIDVDELADAVAAADLVSDHITIGAEPGLGVIYFEADGDTDDVRVTLDRDDLEPGDEINDSVESMLSLDYLKDMTAPLGNGSDTVQIRFGDGMPARFDTEFAGGDGELAYVLAPRLSKE